MTFSVRKILFLNFKVLNLLDLCDPKVGKPCKLEYVKPN